MLLLQTATTYSTNNVVDNNNNNNMDEIPIQCLTTKGPVDFIIQPKRSPIGAKRLLELVDGGYFGPKLPLFRCVENFLCQFGYRPETDDAYKKWDSATILDDVRTNPDDRYFKRGEISFAGGGKNSRSSHLFVTLGKHVSSLGKEPWETQVGYVTESSMNDVVLKWYTGYGDMPPWGEGPAPDKIQQQGLSYLAEEFPKLDYWLGCSRKPTVVGTSDLAKTLKKPFRVQFKTNIGDFEVEIDPLAAPLGAARFKELVDSKFLNDARFFRVINGFVAQYGLPAYPSSTTTKRFPPLVDDPVKLSNVRGTLSFAMAGPNTRTTQLFFNYGDNSRLDSMGFSPLGRVLGDGMNRVLDKFYSGYGEKPNQGEITRKGNEYLNKEFPLLSYIKTVEMIDAGGNEKIVDEQTEPELQSSSAAEKISGQEQQSTNNNHVVISHGNPVHDLHVSSSSPIDSTRLISGFVMAILLVFVCLFLVRRLILNQPSSSSMVNNHLHR
jgi:peptidyl-prolyl cis-trans isomerase A (cyclophilin A)